MYIGFADSLQLESRGGLSLTQCDKMQSAVKRKAEGEKDRKEEEVII